MSGLQACWREYFGKFARGGNGHQLYLLLEGRYNEPLRTFHNPEHIQRCMAEQPQIERWAEHPARVELALLTHGADYYPAREDDVSAKLAQYFAREIGLSSADVDEVYWLALEGRTHSVCPHIDYQLVSDIDYLFLAAPRAEFEALLRNLSLEYSAAGIPFSTKALLEDLLDRDFIFQSGHYRFYYENRARNNIIYALQAA